MTTHTNLTRENALLVLLLGPAADAIAKADPMAFRQAAEAVGCLSRQDSQNLCPRPVLDAVRHLQQRQPEDEVVIVRWKRGTRPEDLHVLAYRPGVSVDPWVTWAVAPSAFGRMFRSGAYFDNPAAALADLRKR